MTPVNTHFKLWRLALIPIGVLVIFLIVAQGINYFAWDYYFTKRFRTIGLGASRELVVGMLGNPDRTEKDVITAPPKDFAEEFRIAPSGPPDFVMYWYGRDRFLYAIGFDRNEKVTTAFYGKGT